MRTVLIEFFCLSSTFPIFIEYSIHYIPFTAWQLRNFEVWGFKMNRMQQSVPFIVWTLNSFQHFVFHDSIKNNWLTVVFYWTIFGIFEWHFIFTAFCLPNHWLWKLKNEKRNLVGVVLTRYSFSIFRFL
jgi:hypothetical protein